MRASPSRVFTLRVDVIHYYDCTWCVACICVLLCNAFYSDTTTTTKRTRKKRHQQIVYVGTMCMCAYGRNRTPLSTAVVDTSMSSAFTTSPSFSVFV
ncbi:hypothetical protein TSMEX_008918, partial [Taenia solium]